MILSAWIILYVSGQIAMVSVQSFPSEGECKEALSAYRPAFSSAVCVPQDKMALIINGLRSHLTWPLSRATPHHPPDGNTSSDSDR
jgi:hypothetical protein